MTLKMVKYFVPVLLIPLFSFGQTLNFKHISYKEGLVQSPISNFIQDNKGFIWFGNLKGLTRYDGYEFRTFTYHESRKTSISNNRVNIIYQDSNNNIWIGTANGLNLYNRDLETFTRIDIREIKGGRNFISSITEDKLGNLWVGTFAGLKKLNRRNYKLEDVFTQQQSESLSSKAVFSLFTDRQNHIWAGTKSGLQFFDPQSTRILPLPASFDPVKFLKVLVTRQDNSGVLWFGTEISGAFKYDQKLNTVIRYMAKEDSPSSLASNWVKDILLYDTQTVWFATRNGISVLHTATNQFVNYKHDALNANSLNDNAVWSFMKDKAACVWVGTFAGGINFYYKGNANFQNIGERIGNTLGLNHVLVNAVSEDKDGSWWVGTFGGGLNHIDRLKNLSQYYSIRSVNQGRSGNGIKSLADDGKGRLWIGSLEGLSLFNKADQSLKTFEFTVKDGKLSENLINAICIDGTGAWVGTNGGGLRYLTRDGTSLKWLRKQTDDQSKLSSLTLSDNFVTALIKDENENIWIGTQNGLNYFDKKANAITKVFQKIRNNKNQIDNSNITTIYIDSQKRLWIGTEGGGLNYYDKSTGRFYVISTSLGLGDNVIRTIVEDNGHHLWLSTDLGIFRLNFKHFNLPFRSTDLEITPYSANDGLISNQFLNNAGIKLHSGEILFGGINGLSVFYPDKIIKNTLPPRVMLTQLLVNNKPIKIGGEESPLKKSISETNEITVPHDENNLSFTYSALNFINPDNNQYAYKLEGMPNNMAWQQAGKQRVVNFANLSPGSYAFKIKASNNDNVWSKEIRALNITVLPPWWLTWWAYLAYTAVIASATIVVIKFLRNRARLKRDLYLEHVQSQRQQELYQMKLNFFTNISHEIRTPLTLILGPLNKIIRSNEAVSMSTQLSLIKVNTDRLMNLVTELLDFRKAEEGHMKIYCTYLDIIPFCKEIYRSFIPLATDKQIEYKLIVPETPLFLYFDRNQLEKVIYNLLSNAFKFTPDKGTICLNLEDKPDGKIAIKVTDNGKGIPADMQPRLFESFFQVDERGRHNTGSGIGLALSKSIVELHKGLISVYSNAGITTFTITLQKGKAHLPDAFIIENELWTPANHEIDQIIETGTNDLIIKKQAHKKYTVLIAEDNDDVRRFVNDILSENYKTVQFANAEDALLHMEHDIPDLIVSDIMMDDMDGLVFCKQVKLNQNTSHIPFILLTAKASVDNQIDGLTTGADAYISKPFSPQILELNVKNLLNTQEVLRVKFSRQFVLQPGPAETVSPEEKFLSKLMKTIENNLERTDFDVNNLANEIGMSRSILYKKVQSLTGYPVADLVKQIRLKKAAELFKQSSSYSVAEVAYMVGFNDRKHFSKEFKKQFDISPSDYIQTISQKI